MADPTSKSLGVAVFDYNSDGWPDLFVANDTQPNKLYRNLGNGTFKEEGLAAGVAFGEDGVARGAMGVDAADYDRSGRPHLVVGNFSNQMLGLYHNEGNGLFVDEAPRSAVGRASLLSLTFGLFFFDYDLDGYARYLRRQRPHRRGDRARAAEDPVRRTAAAVPQRRQRKVRAGARRSPSRWSPAARLTAISIGDGDLDVLIATNNGPARALPQRRRQPQPLAADSAGGHEKQSRRDRRGGRVTSAQGKQWQTVHSGSSYCSASDLALTFGLGRDTSRGHRRDRLAQRKTSEADERESRISGWLITEQ